MIIDFENNKCMITEIDEFLMAELDGYKDFIKAVEDMMRGEE